MKIKACTVCGERKELNTANWRRLSSSPDGFAGQCKLCARKQVTDRYRKWTKRDKLERGPGGVKCMLWAESCGFCECTDADMSECWRIDGIEFGDEDYPVELEQ